MTALVLLILLVATIFFRIATDDGSLTVRFIQRSALLDLDGAAADQN